MPSPHVLSPEATALARRAGIAPSRCQHLARDLVDAAESLRRRRASEVPPGDLEAYVKLRWMRWNAGALQLTAEGLSLHDAAVREARQ